MKCVLPGTGHVRHSIHQSSISLISRPAPPDTLVKRNRQSSCLTQKGKLYYRQETFQRFILLPNGQGKKISLGSSNRKKAAFRRTNFHFIDQSPKREKKEKRKAIRSLGRKRPSHGRDQSHFIRFGSAPPDKRSLLGSNAKSVYSIFYLWKLIRQLVKVAEKKMATCYFL